MNGYVLTIIIPPKQYIDGAIYICKIENMFSDSLYIITKQKISTLFSGADYLRMNITNFHDIIRRQELHWIIIANPDFISIREKQVFDQFDPNKEWSANDLLHCKKWHSLTETKTLCNQ